MQTEHLSILIQGPLSKHSLVTLERNPGVPVVYATWQPNEPEQAKLLREIGQFPDVELVLVDQLELKPLGHLGTLSYQVATTKAGLERIKTPMVIKVRSDEEIGLGNFEPFTVTQVPRAYFGNFIVRPWSYHEFHISDHFFAGPTTSMKQALGLLADPAWPETAEQVLGKSAHTPESQIGLAIFLALHPSFPIQQATSLERWRAFCEWFQLIDMDEFEHIKLFARRANVGPVTSLRQLGRTRNPDGKAIDFAYFNRTSDLRPTFRLHVKAMIWTRYLARTYLAAGTR